MSGYHTIVTFSLKTKNSFINLLFCLDIDFRRYDLILLDIMMPDMDGFELCDQIRSLVDCPIIFLTAKTQESDIVRGLGIGGDDYITKPFGTNELLARVNAHLRRDTVHIRHHNIQQNQIISSEIYIKNGFCICLKCYGMGVFFENAFYQLKHCVFIINN